MDTFLGGDSRFSLYRDPWPDSRSRPGVRYPSPFFDIGHTYLPSDVKSLLRWCRYYFYTNPTVNSAVSKMAAYPLTELHFDTEAEGLKSLWRRILNKRLKLISFLYGVGLDYYTYGNAFVSIVFPFRKILTCPKCKASKAAKEVEYRFVEYGFEGVCWNCKSAVRFKVEDSYYRSEERIHLVRWNPEDIDIDYNPLTGEKRYYYRLPPRLKSGIVMGKRHILEGVPQSYIKAAKEGKRVVLNKCYHFARQSISQNEANMGWGISMVLPVLKHIYYMQILRKAQEMISQEHITPLRILFPTPGSGTADPYSMINLEDWAERIREEIEIWKFDPNYIPVMPLPVGNQTLGGDGRALMLVQELRLVEEEIITGMGVPLEFVKGGLSYTGSSFSLTMLKNMFETYRAQLLELVTWIIKEIASFMDWQPVSIRWRRFHMADDLQRAAFSLQLNQAGKLSDKTLLEEMNYDVAEETEIIAKETEKQLKNLESQQLAQAHMQGEAARVQFRYQRSAEMEQQGLYAPEHNPPSAPQTPFQVQLPKMIDIAQFARKEALRLARLPEQERFEELRKYVTQPQLHSAIMRELNALAGRGGSSALPLPEQKPPRRPMERNPLSGG